MLNDVMSLVVALYALKVSLQQRKQDRFSVGWHSGADVSLAVSSLTAEQEADG